LKNRELFEAHLAGGHLVITPVKRFDARLGGARWGLDALAFDRAPRCRDGSSSRRCVRALFGARPRRRVRPLGLTLDDDNTSGCVSTIGSVDAPATGDDDRVRSRFSRHSVDLSSGARRRIDGRRTVAAVVRRVR